MSDNVIPQAQIGIPLFLGKVFIEKKSATSQITLLPANVVEIIDAIPQNMQTDKKEEADFIIHIIYNIYERDTYQGTSVVHQQRLSIYVVVRDAKTEEPQIGKDCLSPWGVGIWPVTEARIFIHDHIASMICPECGKVLLLSDETCRACGRKITEAELSNTRRIILEQNHQFFLKLKQRTKYRRRLWTMVSLPIFTIGIVSCILTILFSGKGVEYVNMDNNLLIVSIISFILGIVFLFLAFLGL